MYAESVYLVIFFIIPVPYISKLFWAEPVKKSPCRRKSLGSGLIITNVSLRETYEGHVLYIVSEIWGTEEQLICFEVFFFIYTEPQGSLSKCQKGTSREMNESPTKKNKRPKKGSEDPKNGFRD